MMDSLQDWIPMIPAPRTDDSRLRGFRWPPGASEARIFASRDIVPQPQFYADTWGFFQAEARNCITMWCRRYVERLDDREAISSWESEGGR